MTYKITWRGNPRPDLEDAIRADLAEVLGDSGVDDLIFHTFFVTEDINAEIVMIHGTQREDEVIAEFHNTAAWVPVNEVLE